MDASQIVANIPPAGPDVASAAREYLELMLWYPKSTLQLGVTAAFLVAVIAYILPKVERAYQASQASSGKGWIIGVLAPILLVLAAAATKVYAFPVIESPTLRTVAVVAGVALMFLLVIVPATKFIFNSEYVASVLSLGITFVCGAGAVLIVHLGFKAASIGESAAGTIEGRKQEIKEEGKSNPQ